MTQPTFLIIGAQKAGTTWLAQMLRHHPDVYMSQTEIHFFDKQYNFIKSMEWYKGHFDNAAGEHAIGEKTPDYLWANGNGVEGHLPDVHRNIHKYLPDVKLILLLRNPVDRAISSVNHIIRSRRISPLHKIDDLLLGKKRHLVEGHGVIAKGMYYSQIKAYLEYFDRNQILVLFFEECLMENTSLGLKSVCEFLGVNPSFIFRNDTKKVNADPRSRLRLALDYYLPFMEKHTHIIDRYLPSSSRPSKSTISRLYRLYAEENERLFELIGARTDFWKLKV